MEFWGVEVKPGQPLKVLPEVGKLIHISQAALGEVKDVKGAKYVPLRLKIGDKNFVVGTLSAEERPQLMFDIVIEREFELSHDWKNGSVYFLGYIGDDPVSDGEAFSDDFEKISEDEPVDTCQDGEVKLKSGDVKVAKTAATAVKSGDKKAEPSLGVDEDDSDSDDDDDDEDDDMADGAQEDSSGGSGEDEDSDADSSEEELPKVKQSKKRPAALASKAPVPAKKAKAKSATPEKTGANKKGLKAVRNKRK